MSILVDTSVWIDFFNGYNSREAIVLAELIEQEIELFTCGVVAAEFLQGIKDTNTLIILERHFLDMRWLSPREPETYIAAAALFRELRTRGIMIRSIIDCLIAQLAADHNALLLYKDQDMKRIIDSGIIRAKSVDW
jgi:predicted nucleic acid-binding protein